MSGISAKARKLPEPAWFPGDQSFRDIRRLLFDEGIPENFIGKRFRLDSETSMLTTPGADRILRFGTAGLVDAIGVDLTTGHVLELMDAPGSPLLFVNTSLAMFVRTIQDLSARFPYYDTDADQSEIETVSAELLEIVRRVDPPAAEPDRYWSTFVDDSLIGDLTTEAILKVTDGSLG